jgi:hypothetical protein
MKKEWLWGPGRIDPEHQGLRKHEYFKRLADVRERYLNKLLHNLEPENIHDICRIEKARFSLLAEFDRISEEDFGQPQKDVPACRGDCPNAGDCEARRVCGNWSLADFAAHLLTHEEKNIDPEINESLRHMAEHDETHLHQIQMIVSRLRRASR